MRNWFLVTISLAAIVAVPAVWAQTKGTGKTKVVRRAQPPKFERSDKTFYTDAFSEGLVGERPANLNQAVVAAPATSSPGSASTPMAAAPASSGVNWSALISSQTIEDEVKILKNQVDQNVTTPTDFAGKGYKVTRRDLTMLAMLFGIINEYDGEVRWKRDAVAARDTFARTAANAKVGTQQVYQEAKLRKAELQDLVGGSSPFDAKPSEGSTNWSQVCDRAPLMQYLEVIWEPRLKPMLADKGQFTANSDKVLHDAEMFAAIGDVLAKENMPDADSDEYKEFCIRLRDAAKEIVDAVRTKNFDQASKAAVEIGKSCNDCHENYRS